jgi:hypothetical protein
MAFSSREVLAFGRSSRAAASVTVISAQSDPKQRSTAAALARTVIWRLQFHFLEHRF